MTRDETFGIIKSVISENLSIPESELSENTLFIDDLFIDSLTSVEILIEIENRFQLGPTDDSIALSLLNIGQVVDFVLAHKKQGHINA